MNDWGDKSGRHLENLVARFEEKLSPTQFSVKVRKLVMDEEGQQLAEFDVYISGPVGSSSVKWLIECRDRPSEGPAPASWIEQLVSRRTRFGLDKVFAISTTGFAYGAKKYAEEQGITLRKVTQLENIAEDFRIARYDILHLDTSPEGVMDIRTLDFRDNRFVNMRLEDLRFRRLPDGIPQRFSEFILDVLKSQGKLPPPGSDVVVPFIMNDPCEIETRDEKHQVTGFRIDVRVRHQLIEGQGLLAVRYGEEDRVICEEGEFHWDFPGDIRSTSKVTIVFKHDGTMDIHVDLPNPIPPGLEMTSVALYGRT